MSGSNGSGSWDHDAGDISCDRLVIVTTVNSPKSEVLRRVQIGEILKIEIGTQSGREIVAVRYGQDLLGSITSPQLRKLLECLQEGFEYSAAVQSIEGAVCHVRISPGTAPA